jgi:hypothetical protein
MKSLNKQTKKFAVSRKVALLSIGLLIIIIIAGFGIMHAHNHHEPTFSTKPVTSSKSLRAAADQLEKDAKADDMATQNDEAKLESLIQ